MRSERNQRGLAAQALRRASVAAGFLAVAATLGLASCLFEPRVAPTPCDPLTDVNCRPPAPFESPLAPVNVRNNIKAALERPTVEPNYKDSLNEMFRYLPDQFTGSDDPCFANWNREVEVDLMRTILEAAVGIRPKTVTVNFPRFEETVELDEPRKRYNVRYEVVLTFTDSTLTPPTRTDRYGAEANWDFIRDDLNSSWTLERWEDLAPALGFTESLGLLRFGSVACN